MVVKHNLRLLNLCRQQFGFPPVPSLQALEQNAQAIFEETRAAAIRYIIDHEGRLPRVPFPEMHAYKNLCPLRADFSVFLIGTFMPISYLVDLLTEEAITALVNTNGRRIRKPKVPVYHGQRCSQWKVIEPSLIPALITDANRHEVKDQLLQFLQDKGVNYFDVMDWCQRLEYNAADDNLVNILPNIEAFEFLLEKDLDDPVLIFNTSSAFGVNGLSFNANGTFKPAAKSFDVFLSIARQLGQSISFSLDKENWLDMIPVNAGAIKRQMRTKLIFYLKLNNKVFTVVAGVSPSTATLGLTANPCYQAYCAQGNQPGQPAFKRFVYQNAIAKNFDALWPLNE